MAAAFDLGMMLNTAPSANMVQQIACDLLTPYHNHMFRSKIDRIYWHCKKRNFS